MSLEFDCSWRELAAPYALKLQPSMTEAQQKQLHDALQLSTLCSKPFVPVASAPAPSLEEVLPAVAGRPALFVDATQGSDSNGGTLAAEPDSAGGNVLRFSRGSTAAPATGAVPDSAEGSCADGRAALFKIFNRNAKLTLSSFSLKKSLKTQFLQLILSAYETGRVMVLIFGF